MICMKQQANMHRREPNFTVGDVIWAMTKNWKTKWPSRKLDYQMAGLYKVFEKIGNSYKVKLPDSIKVHPVFRQINYGKLQTTHCLDKITNLPCRSKSIVITNGKSKKYWPVNL